MRLDFYKEIEIPRYERQQCVYIIGDDCFVKIGTTDNPFARITSLQVASPQQLEFHLTFIGGKKEERELHRRFRPHHVHGEWFHFSPEIKEFISSHTSKFVGVSSVRKRRVYLANNRLLWRAA
jgi:hypothetical protein